MSLTRRRLARAADAGDGDEAAERERDVDVAQVVLARALDDELAAAAAGGRRTIGTSIARRPDR